MTYMILMRPLRLTDGFYTSTRRLGARQQAPPEQPLELQPHRVMVSLLMAHWVLSPCRWRRATAQDCTVMISLARQPHRHTIEEDEDSEAVEGAIVVRDALLPITT